MRRSPAERVRDRLARVAGAERAATMPAGYQRIGSVLIVRLPPELEPFGATIGAAWQEELGVATVLARAGPVEGEFRRPRVRWLAGGPTETVVIEHGSRWRLDAAQTMFAAGNRVERQRLAAAVRSGERVADLFAGIGYFTVPAARAHPDATFVAVEKNPVAFRYLEENLRSNGVAGRVTAILGDNREVPRTLGAFDRVVLGYLPSSVAWIPRAVELLGPAGGTVHVHLVEDARAAVDRAGGVVERALRSARPGSSPRIHGRAVKPYGPGRTHVVVDVELRGG